MIQSSIAGDTLVKLVESIESGIRNGALSPGEKLPPIRVVASSLGLSPATVAGAYQQLQRRGFLVSQGRRGTIVSARPPLPLALPPLSGEGLINCATGNPDRRLLPKLGPALSAVRRTHALYDEEAPHPELLRLGRQRFREDQVPADAIGVANGSLDGIERALAERLRPGDRIAVEDPCFTGILDLIRSRGFVPVPVALDPSGILPASLTEALKLKPRALIVTPRAQNPSGAAFTRDRVAELKPILKKAPDLFVIEDDHAGPISGVPYHGLCDEQTRHWTVVRSLCKSFGPDLRIALQTGDAETLANVQGRQQLGIRWVSHFLQDMAVHFLTDPTTCRQLERASDLYSERRQALITPLRTAGLPAWGRSGLNVWVPVPDETRVAQSLQAAGFLVSAGARFRLQSTPALRITVASLKPKEAGTGRRPKQEIRPPAGTGRPWFRPERAPTHS
ncbi:MAG: aminotransferase class I/II-fold pyridoxal phosphate-dependent enzyme, partial [Verrucomicrobiota bacterium]